jgi:dihydrodipicolinate synthase/N-acetylneuraminate lyase
VPFDNGKVDYAGHAKNINYLMENNYLSDNRPRVIAIAGTSLIHHISAADQIKLMAETGRQMGEEGVLMSGIVPNPIGDAGDLLEAQAQAARPPDVYLMMPLGGVANPEGMYDQYMAFADKYGSRFGARFLYYFRNSKEMDVVCRLMKDSPHFVGVKVGTGVEDVTALIEGVGSNGMVIWGIGDRATAAAKLGTKGHTSGIAVLVARASDEINNAQRCGDYEKSQHIEDAIAALEDIRFVNGRLYNYSAVVEAMNQSGFDDIVGGNGGPFNPPVPPEVAKIVTAAIEGILEYH